MALNVLLIEDSPANLALITYLVRAYGHTIATATDGLTGVEKALADPYDLILCDLALPKLDGYGVVTRLKAEPATRDVPIIAVTASAMVGDRDKVLAAGFDGYITKPIAPETFVGEVEAFARPRAR